MDYLGIIKKLYQKESFISVKSIKMRSLGIRLKKEYDRSPDKGTVRLDLFEQLKKMEQVQVVDFCGNCKHWWVQVGNKRLCLLFKEYKAVRSAEN